MIKDFIYSLIAISPLIVVLACHDDNTAKSLEPIRTVCADYGGLRYLDVTSPDPVAVCKDGTELLFVEGLE